MGHPDFLTIVEAARVLRIGRTAAYELATRFEASGGAEGLPVVRFGRLLRVPRAQLERIAGGPLTDPSPPAPCSDNETPPDQSQRTRRPPVAVPDQASLPLG